MNIGFVSPGWPPERTANGIVTAVAQFRHAYEAAGHRPLILTPELPPGFRDPAVHAFKQRDHLLAREWRSFAWRIGIGKHLVPPAVRALRRCVRNLAASGRIDIVEIEESWGNPRHLVGHVPVPVVVRLHGPWFLNGVAVGAHLTGRREYARRVRHEGLGIAAADAITSPSHRTLELTRAEYGLPLRDAAVIPNPMRFYPESQLWSVREREPNTILFVGRFDRHKGGDIVLQAFAELARKNRQVKLLFCGPDRGFVDNSGAVHTLHQFIASLNLSSHVRSRIELLGLRTPSEIVQLRRKAAVTVMASRYENLPGVLLEAASLGCPVVAADSGGVREIISDNETGVLVAPNDPDALANGVSRLLEDPQLAARLGRSAWNDGRRRFDPSNVAAEYAAFYENVLLKRSKVMV